jgi:DNA replication protein DnaC
METIEPIAEAWGCMGKAVKDPTGIERALAAVGAKADWILLEGKAGLGKTTLATCIARERVRSEGSLVFLDGYELATMRAEARLGAEPPELEAAKRASLLILDDIIPKPSNPLHDTTAEFVQARHRDGRSTIITSGFPKPKVEERLGAGIARRIYERAFVISLRAAAPEQIKARAR